MTILVEAPDAHDAQRAFYRAINRTVEAPNITVKLGELKQEGGYTIQTVGPIEQQTPGPDEP